MIVFLDVMLPRMGCLRTVVCKPVSLGDAAGLESRFGFALP
jgi:hypothetical protein